MCFRQDLQASLGISVSQFGGTTLTGGLVQGKGMGSYGLGFSLNDRTGLVADVRNSGGTLLSYDTSNGQFAFDSSQFAMSLATAKVQDVKAEKAKSRSDTGSEMATVQKGFLAGLGDSFVELGSRLWNGAKAIPGAVVNAGKWVANTASAAWDGVIYGAKTAWNGVKAAGSWVANTATNAYDWVADGISNTGERIANGFTPDNNGKLWNFETDEKRETRQVKAFQQWRKDKWDEELQVAAFQDYRTKTNAIQYAQLAMKDAVKAGGKIQGNLVPVDVGPDGKPFYYNTKTNEYVALNGGISLTIVDKNGRPQLRAGPGGKIGSGPGSQMRERYLNVTRNGRFKTNNEMLAAFYTNNSLENSTKWIYANYSGKERTALIDELKKLRARWISGGKEDFMNRYDVMRAPVTLYEKVLGFITGKPALVPTTEQIQSTLNPNVTRVIEHIGGPKTITLKNGYIVHDEPGKVEIVEGNFGRNTVQWKRINSFENKPHYDDQDDPSKVDLGPAYNSDAAWYGPNAKFRVKDIVIGGNSGHGSRIRIEILNSDGTVRGRADMVHLTQINRKIFENAGTGRTFQAGTFLGRTNRQIGLTTGAHLHLKALKNGRTKYSRADLIKWMKGK